MDFQPLDLFRVFAVAPGQVLLSHPAFGMAANKTTHGDFSKFVEDLEKNPLLRKEFFQQKTRPYRCILLNENRVPFLLAIWVGDLPHLSDLLAYERQTQMPMLIATNAKFSDEFKQQWEGKVFELSPAWAAIYYTPPDLDSTSDIEKDFACPINRLDPNRQSWFYQLIRRNLLEHGYVSFNMETERGPGPQGMTPHQVFDYFYQTHMLNFQTEHELAQKIVPYNNFDDHDMDQVLLKSKVNVILETYFSFNDQIMITEKTIRSLRLPRPWLLYGAKHSVKYLRTCGFDVLDDIVDHSYDHVDDAIQRQSLILDQLENLRHLDISPLEGRLMSAAQSNNQVLLRWHNAWPQLAFDDFYRIFDDFAKRNNLPTK